MVVQARASSSRLPGKVLARVGDASLLALVLRRLAPLSVDHLVVATGDSAADDAVADVAHAEGVDVVRGPELDVLSRFAIALERYPARTVVRITADCPFVDPALVRAALEIHATTNADYVSNTLVRTYPDGLDVEVVSADALVSAASEAFDPVEREHVTPFVYRRPERFTLRSLRHVEPCADRRFTVDTADDLAFVRSAVERLGTTDFSWEEVPLPEPAPSAQEFTFLPAEQADATFLLELRNDPEVIRWSRSRRAVDVDEHRAWFASVLECPASRVFVARASGRPVGQARVDVGTGVGTVSIAVEPGEWGRGIGTRMLAALLEALAMDEQVHTLVAEVVREHEVSRRLFERAGFAQVEEDAELVRMRRPRRL